MGIEKRKWSLLISIIAAISFVATFYYISIFSSEPFEQNVNTSALPNPSNMERFLPPFGERPRVPFYSLPLLSVLLIVATISMSHYFISMRLENRLEKKFDVISKLMRTNNSVSHKIPMKIDDKNIVLRFLNPSERKVIEKLIVGNGEVLQSEISRLDGMTKLKSHRAVIELERKGIIKRESHGKTHRIILSNDIKEVMLK